MPEVVEFFRCQLIQIGGERYVSAVAEFGDPCLRESPSIHWRCDVPPDLAGECFSLVVRESGDRVLERLIIGFHRPIVRSGFRGRLRSDV